jgi:hypothetical protein
MMLKTLHLRLLQAREAHRPVANRGCPQHLSIVDQRMCNSRSHAHRRDQKLHEQQGAVRMLDKVVSRPGEACVRDLLVAGIPAVSGSGATSGSGCAAAAAAVVAAAAAWVPAAAPPPAAAFSVAFTNCWLRSISSRQDLITKKK